MRTLRGKETIAYCRVGAHYGEASRHYSKAGAIVIRAYYY